MIALNLLEWIEKVCSPSDIGDLGPHLLIHYNSIGSAIDRRFYEGKRNTLTSTIPVPLCLVFVLHTVPAIGRYNFMTPPISLTEVVGRMHPMVNNLLQPFVITLFGMQHEEATLGGLSFV